MSKIIPFPLKEKGKTEFIYLCDCVDESKFEIILRDSDFYARCINCKGDHKMHVVQGVLIGPTGPNL